MNIKQATEQIRNAITAYLSTNDQGLPRIPFPAQRPIVLFGPPGVGKTAVVAQVAEEMDINFVSYSITHHTRQSALGLPFIVDEDFDGRTYSISEYTMSEIIAAVYRAQRNTGVNRGILFLDEVNCASETLAPAMLQFLQYKTFGMHALPQGWVIVCAGNPPEYNRAAREFDPAMLDRLKRIDVEPSLNIWIEYAAAHGVHPAITSFLQNKPDRFYKVAASVNGADIVTPRGWEDLSRMIVAYEAEELPVNEELVAQYLQDGQTARAFSAYWDLFVKYRDGYNTDDILFAGPTASAMRERARNATFDERMALMGLLHDRLSLEIHAAIQQEEALLLAREDLVALKPQLESSGCEEGASLLEQRASTVRNAPTVGTRTAGQVANRAAVRALRGAALEAAAAAVVRASADPASDAGAHSSDAYQPVRESFNRQVADMQSAAARATTALDNAFIFADNAFGDDSQEALMLLTRLSNDTVVVKFVSEYGSDQFAKHNKDLLFAERGLDIMRAVEALDEAESLHAPAGFTFAAE